MKKQRGESISGPVIAASTLALTVAGFFVVYAMFFSGGEKTSSAAGPATPTTAATASPTPTATPPPTPDPSPQLINLTATDGTPLKATFYPAQNQAGAGPALLLLHMAYSNRQAWHTFAQAAQAEGYSVLALDLRGHGDSQGQPQFDPAMDADVDTALEWLSNQTGVKNDSIAAVGSSVGANLALRAAANRPQIRSLALLSPGLNLWEIGVGDAMTRYGQRPVLLVAAKDDEYPAESVAVLAEQAQGEHRLHIFSGASHGTDMFTAHPDLHQLLLDWLHESLPAPRSGPVISSISATNSPTHRLFEKFELEFNVTTAAQNPQWPFDPAPPAGIEPGRGISVDAHFTPDGWQTVFIQPAFYYQRFEHQIKSGQDWIYPTDQFVWKVRFTPHQTGEWQFKLVARDSSGTTETGPQSFVVEPAKNKGFVRISPHDPRYFEFDNGEPFLGLGYQLGFNQPSWTNPTVDTTPIFEETNRYGLQFFRTWLSQWGIFTSAWNPWNAQKAGLHAQYIPHTGLTYEEYVPASEVSMAVDADYSPCMFIGEWKARPAVKPNTSYRVRIKYKTKGIAGPRMAGAPFGFVAKTGGWLWDEGNYCHNPGTGNVVTDYQPENTADWQILQGTITTGDEDFLPNFFVVLENVTAGSAFIDYVWLEEDLGNGQFGPNILPKPWMAHHQYFEQRSSYAFDKVLDLAEKSDIYLKLVVLEKNEWILNRIDFQGNPIPDNPACWDDNPDNNPEKCPGNDWFYGDWREMTKVRWLQQAWWRYLQARWGYSPAIHSWELLNEGDPFNGRHYTLADEFGRTMHQFAPNDHLVTTSFWHSFPGDEFWANADYPNLDYADLHAYAEDSTDTAGNSAYYSDSYGAYMPGGAGKPLVRGETGFSDEVGRDSDGIWLHNYVWANLNPGGMYELYWYGQRDIVYPQHGHDLRYHYTIFKDFMANIPRNNGHYQDVEAAVANDRLRVFGQKDVINGCAHLWIQNTDHTWKNVVDGVSVEPVSGTVTFTGFKPGQNYTLEWWDTYQTDPAQQVIQTATITAGRNGLVEIPVDSLAADIALKVLSGRRCTAP